MQMPKWVFKALFYVSVVSVLWGYFLGSILFVPPGIALFFYSAYKYVTYPEPKKS
jgi:hypothetical protein